MKLVCPQQTEDYNRSQVRGISLLIETSKDQRLPHRPKMSLPSVAKSYSFSKKQRHPEEEKCSKKVMYQQLLVPNFSLNRT